MLLSTTSKYIMNSCIATQWRNRRGGGRVPPETFDREISAHLPGKKRKIVKGKVKIENGRREKFQNEERTFFFFFFFFAFHFSKWLKFVLGLPKWKFATGKKHFTPGKKKSGKITLPPQKKKFLLRPCCYPKQIHKVNMDLQKIAYQYNGHLSLLQTTCSCYLQRI